ncbi:MAG: hypothetical protein KU29_04045 [Sulfurovum sp. FS06-10]|nr:MAG: hypothetical protein KU29_04045 [Sulfurovum sp. FS06-10]
MYKIFKISLIFLSLMTISTMASEILATVNGQTITQEDVNNFVVTSIPGASFDALTEAQRKSVLNQMIERKLFLADAKKSKIVNKTEFTKALEKLKENLILDFWMKEKVEEIVINDKEAEAFYQKNSEKFVQPASVKARHILLSTQEEAQAIIDELMDSQQLEEKFIELAKTKSTGPSGPNGGNLGWFTQDQMVPEFSDAAFAMFKGQISKKPIQTQFGYHVIYVEDKKDKTVLDFKDVKADIVQTLRMQQFKSKLEELGEKLKKTAKITVK